MLPLALPIHKGEEGRKPGKYKSGIRSLRAIMQRGILLTPLALSLMLAACGGDEPAATSEGATVAASDGEYAQQVVKTEEGGYRMGNPDAPVQLVEYGSLVCVHCRDFEQEAFDEIKVMVDSGKLNFEYRNFLLGAIDTAPTVLTRCVGPERYFAFTDAWYDDWDQNMNALTGSVQDNAFVQSLKGLTPQEATAKVAEKGGVIDFFTARGMSADEAKACFADEKAYAEIEALRNHGVKDGVEGTPTFLLNGEKIEFTGWPALKAQLAEAGAS